MDEKEILGTLFVRAIMGWCERGGQANRIKDKATPWGKKNGFYCIPGGNKI